MESARQSSLVHMSSATVWVAPILRIEKSRVSWYSKISWLYQLCTTITLGTTWIRAGTNNLPKNGHIESRCPRLSLVCSLTVERLSEIQGVASSTLAKPILFRVLHHLLRFISFHRSSSFHFVVPWIFYRLTLWVNHRFGSYGWYWLKMGSLRKWGVWFMNWFITEKPKWEKAIRKAEREASARAEQRKAKRKGK